MTLVLYYVHTHRSKNYVGNNWEETLSEAQVKLSLLEALPCHVETHVETDAKTHVKTYLKIQAKSHVETDAKSHVKTHAKSFVKTDAKTNVKTHAKCHVKTNDVIYFRLTQSKENALS